MRGISICAFASKVLLPKRWHLPFFGVRLIQRLDYWIRGYNGACTGKRSPQWNYGEAWLICAFHERYIPLVALPWVLLYKVKGRVASPVTWLFRRLLFILDTPPPFPRHNKHRYLRCFFFCSESLKKKTRKHHLFDDFWPLRDWEKMQR